MAMAFIDFADLKRQVSIAAVLEDRGLLFRLTKRGPHLTGSCPVHQGDNPRAFVVNLEKNVWYCFTGCRSGGDVINLVMRLDHISHYQAACYLQRLRLTPCHLKGYRSDSLRSPPEQTQRKFKSFTAKLPLQPKSPFLAAKGILPSTADRFEAGACLYRGMLCGSVAIRLHDIQGRALGYAGRRLDPVRVHHSGKWVFPTAFPKKKVLYNYHRLCQKRVDTLVVTECPWGVMRLAQLDIPAVALLGTRLFTLQQTLLKKFPNVVLMLDGDRAGRMAAKTIKDQLQSDIRISSIDLPEGNDPDDLDDATLIHLLDRHFQTTNTIDQASDETRLKPQ